MAAWNYNSLAADDGQDIKSSVSDKKIRPVGNEDEHIIGTDI